MLTRLFIIYLIFQKITYEAPSVPVENSTFYTQEFTNKQTLPEIRRFEPPRENFRRSSAKFDGRTTYKDNHRHWVGQKQVPFGELPSFAGKIITQYPILSIIVDSGEMSFIS